MPSKQTQVALEIGKKRTFASALDWPGWARSGRDETQALDALLVYGTRYQHSISSTRPDFEAPTDPASFQIAERLAGNATTDFGAPSVAPSIDSSPINAVTLERLEDILKACWNFFGDTVRAAGGKGLRKGPRGGGRTVGQMVDHVLEAHYGYLRKIYWHEPRAKESDVSSAIQAVRNAGKQPAWRGTVDTALFHPPGRVAHTRPRVGNRRPA